MCVYVCVCVCVCIMCVRVCVCVLDNSYCGIDVLESTLNQEAKTCPSVENPLEATLTGGGITSSHSVEKREYARLLNESTAYAHRNPPRRFFVWKSSPPMRKRTAH